MSDIREVIFPFDDFDKWNLGTLRLPNGIELNMWDMRESHQEKQFNLRINVTKFVAGIGLEEKPRHVFNGNQLLGYRPKGLLLPLLAWYLAKFFSESIGAFIHPSVYMLQDYYPHLRLGQRLGCFDHQLQSHREEYGFRFNEAKQPWPRQEDDLHYALKQARILVCGENGIGKSTLINKVFGTQVVGRPRYQYEWSFLTVTDKCLTRSSRQTRHRYPTYTRRTKTYHHP